MRFHPVRGWSGSEGTKCISPWFQPQGRHGVWNWGSVPHLSFSIPGKDLLLLAVNPSELLLLIRLCDSYRWLFNSEKPWCNGESSFSLCKQSVQRLSFYWVSISLGMNPCLSFKANSRVSPDLHLSPVPCGKCSPWLQDFSWFTAF